LSLAEEVNFDDFAQIKEDLSGTDIKAMCTEAGLIVFRERRMKEPWKISLKLKTRFCISKRETYQMDCISENQDKCAKLQKYTYPSGLVVFLNRLTWEIKNILCIFLICSLCFCVALRNLRTVLDFGIITINQLIFTYFLVFNAYRVMKLVLFDILNHFRSVHYQDYLIQRDL